MPLCARCLKNDVRVDDGICFDCFIDEKRQKIRRATSSRGETRDICPVCGSATFGLNNECLNCALTKNRGL